MNLHLKFEIDKNNSKNTQNLIKFTNKFIKIDKIWKIFN